jgi:iron complex outermembrane receptor protein
MAAACGARAQDAADLAEMSLEQLADIEITSVSRRPQTLNRAAAAVYVITQEAIRRSGYTTLPEILRLAPNLQVAALNNVEYAITARGFNNAVGNKLLVLMDGRTIYTPLFSGVFWEMQDTMIEDIERIEVISGPGATLWGANAVNGVINIITKNTADTQGFLFSGDAGSHERGLAVRAGGTLPGDGTFRVYAKMRDWDETERSSGLDALDEWERRQVGFRADWADEAQTITIQGDAYEGDTPDRGVVGPFVLPPAEISGMNLLGRWTRRFDNGQDLRLQVYWDYTKRRDIILFQPQADIFDVEFQHGIPWGRHRFLWGAGYRYASDDVDPGFFTMFVPEERDLDWQNVFLQDQVQLTDDIELTLGLRLEWNDYTGLEYLPNARLAWAISPKHLAWGSLARAVRAPSRFDRDIFTPTVPPFIVAGGPDFEAEVAHVAQLGYRGQPLDNLSWSVTFYYNDWDDLRSGTELPLPTFLANNIHGESYGMEAWGTWQVISWWRLAAGGMVMDKNLKFRTGRTDTVGVDNPSLHNDPDYQWLLHSWLDLPYDLELDIHLRRVGALVTEPVPAYTELDVRLGWKPVEGVDVSLVGRNLLHRDHPEFGPAISRSELERAVLVQLRVRL